MKHKAHVFAAGCAGKNGKCESCGLPYGAECHAYYSHLEPKPTLAPHRFQSSSNQLHAVCTIEGCGGTRTDAQHIVSEDIHVTVWNSPGVGTSTIFETRGEFLNFALESIANNIPFSVGHVFGNIDGTHPKR
jgi:hypothetical protein